MSYNTSKDNLKFFILSDNQKIVNKYRELV